MSTETLTQYHLDDGRCVMTIWSVNSTADEDVDWETIYQTVSRIEAICVSRGRSGFIPNFGEQSFSISVQIGVIEADVSTGRSRGEDTTAHFKRCRATTESCSHSMICDLLYYCHLKDQSIISTSAA